MKWYLKVIVYYAHFNGRARRKEYWMFFLITAIIAMIFTLTDYFTGLQIPLTDIALLTTLFELFTFTSSQRRLQMHNNLQILYSRQQYCP